jgi:hypothetical protein
VRNLATRPLVWSHEKTTPSAESEEAP